MRRILVLVVLVSMLAGVHAHNAGHVNLPTGTCINVGSNKDAPAVNPAAPSLRLEDGTYVLDLIPGPGDQYGARFAATRGNSRVEPADCPKN